MPALWITDPGYRRGNFPLVLDARMHGFRASNRQDARWPHKVRAGLALDACVTAQRDRAAIRQLFQLQKFPLLSHELPGSGDDNQR
jgi:hypothetical protein